MMTFSPLCLYSLYHKKSAPQFLLFPSFAEDLPIHCFSCPLVTDSCHFTSLFPLALIIPTVSDVQATLFLFYLCELDHMCHKLNIKFIIKSHNHLNHLLVETANCCCGTVNYNRELLIIIVQCLEIISCNYEGNTSRN